MAYGLWLAIEEINYIADILSAYVKMLLQTGNF
jgi:hypothetical protein